ncbi:hypothetical protein [Chitinophaga sp. LS1]|uniref:hypothetical protein n=1 Tax=Chitinophaga sp. LS1 TaxID=3051176 RepID=UPI002AABFDE0|nr:hypothetical protein [Chitinophaga sp. LS1]WPV67797.1 hypothetical protein QQL36_03530 [Chitinophaga sp. LS1]
MENQHRSTSINISGVHNSTVVLGNNNYVQASVRLSNVIESEINSNDQVWKQVIEEMNKLQTIIKELPDEHEEVRDTSLIPAVSQAKKMAKEIADNPAQPKKRFTDRLKDILDITSKVTEVGTRVYPFITTITKLLGISI